MIENRKRRRKGWKSKTKSLLGMIEEVCRKVDDWEGVFSDKIYAHEHEKRISNQENDNKIIFTFPFTNPNHATIICTALNVDKELKPQIVQRTIQVCNENELKVSFYSEDLKQLRSSTTSFMENFKLAVKTIMAFDIPFPNENNNLEENDFYTKEELNDPEIEILAVPKESSK